MRRIISLSFASPDGPAESGESTLIVAPQAASDLTPPTVHCCGTKELDSTWISLEQLEREHILRTLDHTFYNRSAAARLLGVTRQSLLRKMNRYKLDISDERER